MKKIIVLILKRILLAICIVYAFNLIATGLKIFIPINLVTISVVSVLGMSGLLACVAIYFVLM